MPHSIFPGQQLLANRLTIRLQPEEDISLLLDEQDALTFDGGRHEAESRWA